MNNKSRRVFIKNTALLTAGATIMASTPIQLFAQDKTSTFKLPDLPYAYNALEPSIDELTMRIHHTKHHQAYVNNLNTAIAKYDELTKMSIESLVKNIESFPADVQTAIRNNGGGHWNHTFFWNILTTEKDTKPSKELIAAIEKHFPSYDIFLEEFNKAAGKVFGSGWVWLIVTPKKSLKLVATPNQDNPLMSYSSEQGTPILGIDVWEHAYYLKHQNVRANYIKDFWSVVNWKQVNTNFETAMK
jgi:Fe-Mn family superoxide dismutase